MSQDLEKPTWKLDGSEATIKESIASSNLLLNQYNQEQLHKFKEAPPPSDSSQVDTIALAQAFSSPKGKLYFSGADRYSKRVFKAPEGGKPDIQLLFKNGNVQSFSFKTNADGIRNMVRHGIYKPQSALGAAIATAGQYRLKRLKRMENGVISDMDKGKCALLDKFQDLMETLKPLERAVNTDANPKDVIEAVQENLEQLKAQGIEGSFNKELQEAYNARLASLISKLEKRKNDNQSDLLSPTGRRSFMTLVKQAISSSAVFFQNQNINMLYKYSRFRGYGDFNGYMQDVIKGVYDYKVDYHNPIKPEHQGDFGKPGEELVFDSDALSLSPYATLEDAVTFLPEVLKPNQDAIKSQTITTEPTKRAHPNVGPNVRAPRLKNSKKLKETKSPKWMGLTGTEAALAAPKFISNVITGVVGGIADGFIIAGEKITGTKASPPLRLSQRLHFNIKTAHGRRAQFQKQYPEEAVVDKFYRFMGNAAKSLGANIAGLATGTVKAVREHIVDGFRSDWTLGDEKSYKAVEEKIGRLRQNLNTQKEAVAGATEQYLNTLEGISQSPEARASEEEHAKQATLPYSLQRGVEFNDATSQAVKGLYDFSEEFTHNIHAKNPTIGMAFNALYAQGFAAIALPKIAAIMAPHKFNQMSASLGKAFMKGGSSAGVSGGFTQAQITAALLEQAKHGEDAWLMKFLDMVQKEPLKIATIATAATAIGYGLQQAHIPFLSDAIKEEVGSVKELAWGFTGAKLTLLTYEFLVSHHGAHEHSHEEAFKEKVKTAIKENLESKNNVEPNAFNELSEEKKNARLKIMTTIFMEDLNEQKASIESDAGRVNKTDQEIATQISSLLASTLDGLKFHTFLHENKDVIKLLTPLEKKQLYAKAERLLPKEDDKEHLKTIRDQLFPESESADSIAATTVKTILKYPFMLVRGVLNGLALGVTALSAMATRAPVPAEAVSAAKKPWIELGENVSKDLTRLGAIVGKLAYTVGSYIGATAGAAGGMSRRAANMVAGKATFEDTTINRRWRQESVRQRVTSLYDSQAKEFQAQETSVSLEKHYQGAIAQSTGFMLKQLNGGQAKPSGQQASDSVEASPGKEAASQLSKPAAETTDPKMTTGNKHAPSRDKHDDEAGESTGERLSPRI